MEDENVYNEFNLADHRSELFCNAFMPDITKISDILNAKRQKAIMMEYEEILDQMEEGEQKRKLKQNIPNEHMHYGIKAYLGKFLYFNFCL